MKFSRYCQKQSRENGGLALLILLLTVAASCSRAPEASAPKAHPLGKTVAISAPLGLPPVPIPASNPPTERTIQLGRKLFYDPKVSVDNSIACASCHNSTLGFTDRQRVSTGVNRKAGKRNAPTVLNAAYVNLQFWDGRAGSLEEQAAGPIANPVEMNHTHDVFLPKLNSDPVYREEFRKAFGEGTITMEKVEMALASFERTLLSGDSPFDQYRYGENHTALNTSEIRGLAVFQDKQKGNCAACHTIDKHYALFSDGKFHNIGIGVDENGELVDAGRFDQTKVDVDRGAFRTPSLRNIALTAPYMHDGSKKTLRDVVDYYVGGGNSNPNLDHEMRELHLSEQEKNDLVAFLCSLTGQVPPGATKPSTGD